jgi:hypothetical protein
MDAGVSDFLGFLRSKNSERRKNGMDAGCFQFLGFSRSENPKPKNGRTPLL